MPILDAQGRIVAKEPVTPETREFTEGADYTVSMYQGKYPNYECVHCQFATLYMPKLEEHFAYEQYHQHRWAHPVPPDQQAKPEESQNATY